MTRKVETGESNGRRGEPDSSASMNCSCALLCCKLVTADEIIL